MAVRLGYACINLSNPNLSTNRGIQRKTFDAKGVSHCTELAVKNAVDLLEILKWNLANGILVYRMSSDIIPWATEWFLNGTLSTELQSCLAEAGKFAIENSIRLSFHPGPYNCPGSPTESVIAKTVTDLECHSRLMDLLEQPGSPMAKINIHVGGSYGNKAEALSRVVKTYSMMSKGLRSRLTFENDDTPSLYSVKDLYGLYEQIGTPVVFDGHHWEVGSRSGTYQEDFLLALRTWGTTTPTVHWSNSRKLYEDANSPECAHSDKYYKPMLVPDIFSIDIMLESKLKDLSLIQYRKDFYNVQADN